LDLIHNPITQPWSRLSLDTVYNEIPTVLPFLKLHQLTVRSAGFSVLKELASSPIYSELIGYGARIEIPIIGCEYGHTVYYRAEPKPYVSAVTGQYGHYHSDSAEELARFTLCKPTVVNTRIPRRTTVTRRHVRRISLMLDVGPAAYTMLTNPEAQ
jgi:hypothetical protein